MKTITGKIKKIIYQNEDNGYTVALFKVQSSDVQNLKDTTVQVIGNFFDLKYDCLMEINGDYELNQKYNRYQFSSKNYCMVMPSTEDKILEFLKSSFINGCGIKTAEAIVDMYGKDTLNKIKDYENILKVPGMTEKKAMKIHDSVISYDKTSDLIIKLESAGFSVEESARIINKFKDRTTKILENSFYDFKEVIDFKKLDHLYQCKNDSNSNERIYHCTLEAMENISFSEGHTYYDKELVLKYLRNMYNVNILEESFDDVIKILCKDEKVVNLDNKLYLMQYYEAEKTVATNLKLLSDRKIIKIKKFDEKIIALEKRLGIDYDTIQESAIKAALNNSVTILSGGPGTGKTTILNAILKMYLEENKDGAVDVALIAPTGRASKKMSMSTGLSASTIHSYLKWHKETDSFLYDEFNHTSHKFIVVDEASMIDIKLFSALLKAIRKDAQLILVGDAFQLPSVSAGRVLNDLIESDLFQFVSLTKIYRQSENSFIPYLAKEIKNGELEEDFLSKKDDYNFINCDKNNLSNMIKEVILNAKSKKISEDSIQVLAPMYKGENGIDNLNYFLREVYNPRSNSKKEVVYNDITYRENDKVLQLINDPDNDVFNGDIGYIKNINSGIKTFIDIEFEDSLVTIEKKSLKNIKHAYAITIHKSQGSEFEHVIMPISSEYYMMMFNKLLYTGVSRAKKSLVLIGDVNVFARGVQNNRADFRNTSLKTFLNSIFLDN